MDVKVLGLGCKRCQKLYDTVERAIGRLGVEATLAKVEDPQQMVAYRVWAMPALVIDGEVKSVGRIPGDLELRRLLTGTDG